MHQSSPLLQNVEGDMLKIVVLHSVVRFQDAPDRKHVPTREVERRRLVEAPAISLCCAVTTGVVLRDASEFMHKLPVYSIEISSALGKSVCSGGSPCAASARSNR